MFVEAHSCAPFLLIYLHITASQPIVMLECFDRLG
jgi:hypothetical protein